MSMNEKELLKRLLATFKVEAEEHVSKISSGLVELERATSADERMVIVETIFRKVHTLKGAARTVNMLEIEALCQSLESVFAALRDGVVAVSPTLLDTLYRAVDNLVESLLSTGASQPAPTRLRTSELIQDLRKTLEEAAVVPQQEAAPREAAPKIESQEHVATEKLPSAETMRVPAAKLGVLFRDAEEMIAAKLTATERAAQVRHIQSTLAQWHQEWTKMQPKVRMIRQLLEKGERNGNEKASPHLSRLLEFFDWNYAHIKFMESNLTALARSADHDGRALGTLVDNLLEDIKRVLLLPCSSALEAFPRSVRDLSRDQGKEVDLVIRGGDIEVDKRILEEMKDPLLHLVRNCIDHGIEKPAERTRKMKRPRGTITIAIAQKDSGRVEILISDDGAGIDFAKLKATALKAGICSEEEAKEMSAAAMLQIIFRSGISTSPIITDISGRGLGLAIVQERVAKLGGTISVESELDQGTTFKILLPLTLATFRGVLVREGEHIFVVPTANVERVTRIKKEEIKTIENRETIQLNGQALSLARLGKVLELPQRRTNNEDIKFIYVLVIGAAERRIAFSVDAVLNEQEVLVKSTGKQLSRVRNIAGAAILGTGQVAPILNASDLMKSAVKMASAPTRAAAVTSEAAGEKKSVLVVEDSITTRALLRNILEMAGYTVKTAVDGIDALTVLKTDGFDLVVSDVEMPRMDGFDLTVKIRADKNLANLPVVLVTALESREDRERGIDVGANAYIVKSSFDQSNLLEVIQRLI